MPTLKIIDISYRQITHRDLDNFIKEVYGLTYFSCAAVEEWDNDTYHQFIVRKCELNEWDLKKLEKVKNDEESYRCLRAVLQDLANRDLIEPGSYLISFCW